MHGLRFSNQLRTAPLIGAIRASSLEKKVENPSRFKRLLQLLWGQQNENNPREKCLLFISWIGWWL